MAWLRQAQPTLVALALLLLLALVVPGLMWMQNASEQSTATAKSDPVPAKADREPKGQSLETLLQATISPKPTPKDKGDKGHEGRQQSEPEHSDKAESLASAVEDVLGDTDPEPAVFQLVSFNVLGSSHTDRGGNKPRFASGSTRMHAATQLVNGAGADVVGFQEFEEPQFRTFMNLTGGAWSVFPGMSMGRGPVRNSIAWRNEMWDLVDRGTIPVPYFHGQRVPMPWVVLEHKATGHKIAFINIHNPVSNKKRGNNERWRDVATSMEVNLVKQLRGTAPVVLMGDFNEHEEAFCRVTNGAGMHAANGGAPGPPCRGPAGMGIDWIFGTSDVAFSDYLRHQDALVRRTSDHPLVKVTLTLGS